MSNHHVKRRAQSANCYFSFGGAETPVPLPYLPPWMLNTPMHSKLPMIPAPKGKIILYTTELCQKLHHTLRDLDFDPNPQGLSTEYKSLHDKHLKTYYSHPSTITRLIRSGFVTPEGKVICTLKEFNDFQQQLKRVRLEKVTQERKRMMANERQERDRMRRAKIKTAEQLSREQRSSEAQQRTKKAIKERQIRLSQQQNDDSLKRIRVLEERRRLHELEEARKKMEQERHRSLRMQTKKEERKKKVYYIRKRAEEDRKREAKLEQRRVAAKEAREKRLEEQWDRKQRFQELRRAEQEFKTEMEYEALEANILARELAAERERLKQQDAFCRIQRTQSKKAAEKEDRISRHLGKKHQQIQSKFKHICKRLSAKQKGIIRAVPPHAIQPKRPHTERTSAWHIPECLMNADFYVIKPELTSSNKSSTKQLSSQELPAVSRSGSARAVTRHGTMSDLPSREKLPPIGTTMFNEEDDDDILSGSKTPEPFVSDDDSSQVVFSEGSLYECVSTTAEFEEIPTTVADVPIIEIQLDEHEQSTSLEFTQDDFEHFELMDSSESCEMPTPAPSAFTAEPEKSSNVNISGRPESVEVVGSVVIGILQKVFSGLFKCAGSSDTLSPTEILVNESNIVLQETSHVTEDKTSRGSIQTASCHGADMSKTKPSVTELTNEGTDSIPSGIITDNSLTSFGLPATQGESTRTITPSSLNVEFSSDGGNRDLSDWESSSSVAASSAEESRTCLDEDTRDQQIAECEKQVPTEVIPLQTIEGSSSSRKSENGVPSQSNKTKIDNMASQDHILEEEDSLISVDHDEEGYNVTRSSMLLRSLIDVFGESPANIGEFRSSSESEDESDDEVEEDEAVIGILENAAIVKEIGMSTVAECVALYDQAFTEIVSVSDENRVSVEGAIRRASSGDFVGQRASITEAVLSIQNLTKVSSSHKVLEKVSGKQASSYGDNGDPTGKFLPEEHYHQIIPIYHNHSVDVGEDLIENNLSAISIKPDSKGPPHAHQTANRNSFRNIFRPDMTYCEGSARCLKSTLISQLSHSSSMSSSSSHAHVMALLDKEHHDVTEHHSDEEFLTTDDVEGVCVRPKRQTFKVHYVYDDVVKEQDELSEEISDDIKKESFKTNNDIKDGKMKQCLNISGEHISDDYDDVNSECTKSTSGDVSFNGVTDKTVKDSYNHVSEESTNSRGDGLEDESTNGESVDISTECINDCSYDIIENNSKGGYDDIHKASTKNINEENTENCSDNIKEEHTDVSDDVNKETTDHGPHDSIEENLKDSSDCIITESTQDDYKSIIDESSNINEKSTIDGLVDRNKNGTKTFDGIDGSNIKDYSDTKTEDDFDRISKIMERISKILVTESSNDKEEVSDSNQAGEVGSTKLDHADLSDVTATMSMDDQSHAIAKDKDNIAAIPKEDQTVDCLTNAATNENEMHTVTTENLAHTLTDMNQTQQAAAEYQAHATTIKSQTREATYECQIQMVTTDDKAHPAADKDQTQAATTTDQSHTIENQKQVATNANKTQTISNEQRLPDNNLAPTAERISEIVERISKILATKSTDDSDEISNDQTHTAMNDDETPEHIVSVERQSMINSETRSDPEEVINENVNNSIDYNQITSSNFENKQINEICTNIDVTRNAVGNDALRSFVKPTFELESQDRSHKNDTDNVYNKNSTRKGGYQVYGANNTESGSETHIKDDSKVKHDRSESSRPRHSCSGRSKDKFHKTSTNEKTTESSQQSSCVISNKKTNQANNLSTNCTDNQSRHLQCRDDGSEDVGSRRKSPNRTNKSITQAIGCNTEKLGIVPCVKRNSKRSIGACRSTTGGTGRSSCSRISHIGLSKSANSPSKTNNTMVFVRSQTLRTQAQHRDVKYTTNSKTTSDTTAGNSSSSNRQHSVILVQPVKQKRSSCTVILSSNRSSQLSVDESHLPKDMPTTREKNSKATICMSSSVVQEYDSDVKDIEHLDTDTAIPTTEDIPLMRSNILKSTASITKATGAELSQNEVLSKKASQSICTVPSSGVCFQDCTPVLTPSISNKPVFDSGVSNCSPTSNGSIQTFSATELLDEDKNARQSCQISQPGKKKSDSISDTVKRSIGNTVLSSKRRSSRIEPSNDVEHTDGYQTSQDVEQSIDSNSQLPFP